MQRINITLQGKTYQVPVDERERDAFEEAYTLLSEKLKDVSHMNKESAMAMVALNLSFELIQLKHKSLAMLDNLDKELETLAQEES